MVAVRSEFFPYRVVRNESVMPNGLISHRINYNSADYPFSI